MRTRNFVVAFVLGAAYPALGQELPQQSRRPLGEAIREVLIETPALLLPLTETAPLTGADLYADETARDVDLLARAAPRLFAPGLEGFGPEGAPSAIAFFTQEDCPDCAIAEAELRNIASKLGLRVSTFDMARDADLAAELGLDMAPSYVLPSMMLRGAMPAIVLEKYLRP